MRQRRTYGDVRESVKAMSDPAPSDRRTSVSAAPLRFLPLLIPALPVCLALLSLFFPSVRAFLAAGIALLLLGLGVLSLVLAVPLWQTRRLVSAVSRLTRSLEAQAGNQTPLFLPLVSRSDLAPLAGSLARLARDLETREKSCLDVLTSNRLLARDLLRVSHLLNAVRHGILTIDGAQRIVLANRPAEAFLQTSAEDARGKPIGECLRCPEVMALLSSSESEGQSRGVRTMELPPDEKTARGHTAVFVANAYDGDDVPVGQTLVFEDVSHAKNVEKMQTEFVDCVAHELRTPLTSIRAYVEMLIDGDTSDPGKVREFYNIIYQETYRLSELIDNLLNISAMESGTARLYATPTRLRKLLEDCAEVVRPQCEDKSIQLVTDLPDRLPVMDIDKRLFQVAVMNILGNAVKYTPNNGRVTLATGSNENELLVTIQDTGIGIPEGDLGRIFEKFFRCQTPGTEKVPGSGIGLATAQQIIRLHGGEIRVASTLGQGSQFTLALPRSLINTTHGD
jgi:signal transduction histidine kinase